MQAVTFQCQLNRVLNNQRPCLPGPEAALTASSPMKKSRSSVPRFELRCPEAPAPPVRKDGLLATAGRPDPVPPPPPTPPFVAIAVGKTKDGESFPAKPMACHVSSNAVPNDRATVQILIRNHHTKLRETRSAIVEFTLAIVSCRTHGGAEPDEGALLVHDNGGRLVGHG